MKKEWIFAGVGFLAGAIGLKAVKSETAKKIGVSAVSQGLKIKDSIDESIESIKENVDDVVAEAKLNNKREAEAKRATLDLEEIKASDDIEAESEEE